MTVDLGTDLEVMENLSCYDLMAKDLLIPASCTYIGLYAIGSGPRNSKDATLKVHANNPVYADYGANAVVHKATGILIAAYGTVKYNANVKGIYEKQVSSSLYSGKVPFLAGGAIGYTTNGFYVTTFKDVQNTTGIFLHMNGFFPDREPLYLTTGKSRRSTYRHDDFNLFDISFPLTKAELQSCTGYPWFLSGKTIQCSDGRLKPH